MAGKPFRAEQIIIKLREAEVGLAQGQRVGQVSKQIGVTGQPYCRWRKEYGGLRMDQTKRLKNLEVEYLGSQQSELHHKTTGKETDDGLGRGGR